MCGIQVTIGKVLKPRGLSGEVKVQILTNMPDVFLGLKSAEVGKTLYQVRKSSVQNGFAYIVFDGINSVESAEKLRGLEIKIPRERLSIDADEILSDDLLGFDVVSGDGKKLGVVRNIESVGASEVIDCGSFMFPYEDAFVLETDMTAKRIVIKQEMLEEEVIL